MFLRERQDEHLDRVGKSVVRSGGISDQETEAIASSPFMYARLRARIEAERLRPERRRDDEPQAAWFATIFVARRAIPALMLVAIFALSAFWLMKTNQGASKPSIDPRDYNIARVAVGGTCALSSAEECAISTDEVLATLFADEEVQR
jgi:hypothetical protein